MGRWPCVARLTSMWSAIRAHLDDAAPERPTRPSKGDAYIALLAASVALAEGALRTSVALRPLSIAAALVVAGSLLFRRSNPLPALLVGFLAGDLLLAIEVGWKVERLGLHAGAFVLLQPFSLLRYGTAREVGLGVLAVVFTYTFATLSHPVTSDAIGAAVVLCLPIAAGAALRFRDGAHRRDVEHAQLRERQAIARELHDTVAHHVSAIAVQAQAGRVVAATRPDAALDALAVIEEEATRALDEMRSMVGTLRQGDPAALRPQQGVRDLPRLERHGPGPGPRVVVTMAGDLDGLRPSVDAACFRLAQEAVTNALRHARHASEVQVRVDGADDQVRITVVDDGQGASPSAASTPGFGLVGMAERAKLLGGTFDAGPAAGGGWTVAATIPRRPVAT